MNENLHKKNIKKDRKSTELFMLLFDLYWLRYKKQGEQWYELTDYLREKLIEDGLYVEYTRDDLLFGGDKESMTRCVKHGFEARRYYLN